LELKQTHKVGKRNNKATKNYPTQSKTKDYSLENLRLTKQRRRSSTLNLNKPTITPLFTYPSHLFVIKTVSGSVIASGDSNEQSIPWFPQLPFLLYRSSSTTAL
jgi:hypothetical protein